MPPASPRFAATAARCEPMRRCARQGDRATAGTSKPPPARFARACWSMPRAPGPTMSRRAAESRRLGFSRCGGPWFSCGSGATGLRDLPLVTDLHGSFYFKGEGDRSVWVSPLDETPVDPCDAAPEEIDVAIAIDRFEQAVDWPVEAVERKWAGLRSFAPDRTAEASASIRSSRASSGARGRAGSASRPRRPRPCCARR